MVFNSKKGLSPLIAAVLLIVVVVGIGAVVTGMVREKVTEDKDTISKTSSTVDCATQVNIKISKIEGDTLICKGSDFINFTIENVGSVDIDDFQLKVFGAEGFVQNDSVMEGGLERGKLAFNYIAYFDSATTGAVSEISLIPKIRVAGFSEATLCTDSAIKYAGMSDC